MPRSKASEIAPNINIRLPSGTLKAIDYWVQDQHRFMSRSDFISTAINKFLADLARDRIVDEKPKAEKEAEPPTT